MIATDKPLQCQNWLSVLHLSSFKIFDVFIFDVEVLCVCLCARERERVALF